MINKPTSYTLKTLLVTILFTACQPNQKIDVGENLPDLESIPDKDGDGYLEGEDCDDTSDTINPAALETCDGTDNNCDGQIDEGVQQIFYADVDGDGFGDPSQTISGCEGQAGYVPVANDCNDNDASIFPGATEACDDIDNDCDGIVDNGEQGVWYEDNDGDGYGKNGPGTEGCQPGPTYVQITGDCDDSNNLVYPGSLEECDGIDNNCDGEVDEGGAITFYQDTDGDGYGNPAVVLNSCEQPTGYVENDLDCDDTNATLNPDTEWYIDTDGDGYGNPDFVLAICEQPTNYVDNDLDCNDSDSNIHPNAVDVCDGVDNNCNGSVDDGLQSGSYYYLDVDSDGYGDPNTEVYSCTPLSGYIETANDCDDNNQFIYPGATEVCDSVDNDCNALIDDNDPNVDLATGTIYYGDNDADGFGDDAIQLTACSQPTGYSNSNTDCNDQEATVYPNAPEVCDQLDNDCDGDVDDDDANLSPSNWYIDNDNDGYGDSTQGITLSDCSEPTGYAPNADDCNDDDELTSPGITENCTDDQDNDCDTEQDCNDSDCALDEECFEAIQLCTGNEDYGLSGESSYAYAGYAIAAAGDVNGDGIGDVLVGAYGTSNNGSNSGTSYLLFGGAISSSGDLSSANCSLNGENSWDYSGWSVAGNGDVDGDGKSDILISAPNNDDNGSDAGKVYLFLGSSISGICNVDLIDADYQFLGEQAGDQAGYAVSMHGDLDGDGLDDIVIGAPGNDDNGTQSGKMYVVLGSSLGSDTTIDLSVADYIYTGEQADDYAGHFVTITSDINGDGNHDLMVGAPSSSNSSTQHEGYTYVLYSSSLSPTSSLGNADHKIIGENQEDMSGSIFTTTSDLNDDGMPDIVVASPNNDEGGEDAGKVYIVYTSSLGSSPFSLSNADHHLIGEAAGDYAGSAITSLSDSDDDGFDELIVGAYGNDSGTGKVYILSTSQLGVSDIHLHDSWYTLTGENSYDWFGRTVANLGDISVDGKDDLSIGAPNFDGTNNASGKLYISLVPFGQNNSSIQSSIEISPDSLSNVLTCSFSDCLPEPVDAAYTWTNLTTGQIIGSDKSIHLEYSLANHGDELQCSAILTDLDGNSQTLTSTQTMSHLTAATSFTGKTVNAALGTALTTVSDIDGDGRRELILTAPNQSNGAEVYFVTSSSLIEGELSLDPYPSFTTGNAQSTLSLLNIGDISGDNQDDVLIGAPYNDDINADQGKIYLSTDNVSSAAYTWDGENAGDLAGYATASLNLDADALMDLVVSAPEYGNTGKVYIITGQELTNNPSLGLQDATYTFTGGNTGDEVGYSLGSNGDFDGDGLDDLLIGAPGIDKVYLHFAASLQNTTINAIDHSFYSIYNGYRLGHSLAVLPDLDQDGLDDFIMGAPFDTMGGTEAIGAAYIHFSSALSGSNIALSSVSLQIYAEQENSLAGMVVSSIGDVDNDGQTDIAIAAPGYDVLNTDAGRVFVFTSTQLQAAGTLSLLDAASSYSGTHPNEGLGTAIVDAGDQNGDGIDDILIGSSTSDQSYDNGGQVYVIYGW